MKSVIYKLDRDITFALIKIEIPELAIARIHRENVMERIHKAFDNRHKMKTFTFKK